MNWLLDIIKSRQIYFYLLVLASINLLIFSFMFGFHVNNDTDSFIWTIERFRGIDAPFHPNRYLNPFYPIIGATLLRFLSPGMVIILLNVVFYYILILLTYSLVNMVFKNRFVAIVTAIFFIPNYSFIRYGLTQVQDMGGYFWFILCIYGSWMWRKSGKDRWLYLAGSAVGFGLLTKESGAMGALFFAGLLLIHKVNIYEKIVLFIKFSIIPFSFLVINSIRSKAIGYNSLQWFLDAWDSYGATHYKLYKLIGVNISTYNLVIPLFFIGLGLFVKNYFKISNNIRIFVICLIIPSLSFFAWPVFISRTVIISGWLVFSIAAYAAYSIYSRGKIYKFIVLVYLIFCLLSPFVLQNIIKYGHIFDMYEKNNMNFFLTWQECWTERDSFSELK